MPNHTLDALSISVTPAPDSGYEAANLLDPDRTKICRVTAASITITISMSGNPWVHAMALTGLEYTPSAQVKIMGDDTQNWTSPDYDSGWQGAYPAALGFGGDLFGRYGFGGYVTPEDFPYYRPTLLYHLPTMKTYAWYRIVISDPNNPTGKIGIGIVALLTMIEMSKNFSYGWPLRAVDTTTVRKSTAGQPKSGRPGTRYNVVGLDFRLAPDEEKWAVFEEMKKLGRTGLFFLSIFPASGGVNETFATLYGHLEKLPEITHPLHGRYDMSLTFAEVP
jgi:hypothetical protein